MPQTSTTSIRQAWSQRATPFTAVVDAVQDWGAASPCEGWSAADVVTHVMQTEREFLAERGIEIETADSTDPRAAWHTHDSQIDALLADDALASRPYEGAFGPTTIGETLVEFYAFDLIVHRWDLARSQGVDERLTEAELTTVDAAIDGWGEHAYAPGIFATPVEVGPEADAQTRVLARTGRSA